MNANARLQSIQRVVNITVIILTVFSQFGWAVSGAAALGAPMDFGKSNPTDTASDILPSGLSLSWGDSFGADTYEYCIDSTGGDTCSGTNWVSTGANTSVTLDLSASTIYTWQVRAVNSVGTTLADTGSLWSFTTGINISSPVITEGDSTDLTSTVIFNEGFDSGLDDWNLFGSPTPFIDTGRGNPAPAFQINGDSMYFNSALTKQVFTPTPGMTFQADMRISDPDDPKWVEIGLSRIFDPHDNYDNLRQFVGIGGVEQEIYIGGNGGDACETFPLSLNTFYSFKFVVTDTYQLLAYMNDTFICKLAYTVDEFVNKPLDITGRSGLVDNVIVTKPASYLTLHATDADSAAFTWSIISPAAHGTALLSDPATDSSMPV